MHSIYDIFIRLRESPLPSVAAVNGPAIGAGMNLALACDVRIAAESAMFSARFLDLALHPGGGHTWMLQQALGTAATNAMVLFGQELAGREAEDCGLAWRCVPDSDVVEEALAMARTCCRAPREVVEAAKATIAQTSVFQGYADAVEMEIRQQLWSAQQDAFISRMADLTRSRPAPA